MASTYKTLTNKDMVSTKTLLHEAIPVTGAIVSGTYGVNNIKNYVHGMFQSVYDYPYLSSSANHIFDLTVGLASGSQLSASSTPVPTQLAKKCNMYNEMAQVLVGFNDSNSIEQFDKNGVQVGGTKMKDVFFVNLARLLSKDEIKKGTFQMSMLTGGTCVTPTGPFTVYDSTATTYLTNSPAGEYTVLHTSSVLVGGDYGDPVGLLYYQAGIVVLTASVFGHMNTANYFGPNDASSGPNYKSVRGSLVSGSISGSCAGFRNRITNIQFNNTTELNSTIYFCRVNHNDFNYSSNPTYLSESKIRVKTDASDTPKTFITKGILLSPDNVPMATFSLSNGIENDSNTEFSLRVRLDY